MFTKSNGTYWVKESSTTSVGYNNVFAAINGWFELRPLLMAITYLYVPVAIFAVVAMSVA